ncbi:MAG: hypothetical protein GY788_30635, partial [bacterium]|nr:hypothetical protein [bacterium]
AVYLYDSDGSQILNSRIAHNTGSGIYAYYSDNLTLSNNTINNNSDSGVYFYSSDYATFIGNSINDNSSMGVYFSYYNDYATFVNNVISGNGNYGVYFYRYNDYATFNHNTISSNSSYGVYFSSYSNDYIAFDRNTIANNINDGFYVNSGYGYTLDNNIIARNGGEGMEWNSGSGTLRHNTFSDNSGNAGLYVHNANLVLTNTIVASHTYGIRTTNTSANIQADYTLWHGNTQDTGAAGGSSILTSHDRYGDPRFAGGSDAFSAYHLRADSAAIDAGADTGLTTDIDGHGRAPDIGADEFPYTLSLTPDTWRTTSPNTIVTYAHTLRNSGGLTDTVALTAVSSQGWTIQMQPLTATLGSGASVPVTLTVNVPAGSSGLADISIITAASLISPAIQTTAQDTTMVDMGVIFSVDEQQTTTPGMLIIYTHHLTNTGTSADTFALTLDSSQGWATLLNSSPVTLAAEASTSVQVQVSVPVTTVAGLVETTLITATSTSVPAVLDTVQDTTTVLTANGVRYVASSGNDTANNCLDSSHPCQTVMRAAVQAQSGDEVRLATGVYTNTHIAIEGRLLTIDKELTLAGGYSMSNWNTQDPQVNPTILDAEGLGQVLYADTAGITVTVSGLTMQRGSGNSVEIHNARLLLSHSEVISATNWNYAVYLYDSDGSQILNSRIAHNTGSGIYAYYSDNLTLSNNTINNNSDSG